LGGCREGDKVKFSVPCHNIFRALKELLFRELLDTAGGKALWSFLKKTRNRTVI
jgi:hypothetical protein